MSNKNHRLSKNRDEILKVLNSKFTKGCKFIVWQKKLEENKDRDFKINAIFESIDMDNGVFTIRIIENGKKNFNKNHEIYLLLEGEDFAFKTKASIVQPNDRNLISIQAPKEVRLKEFRNNTRVSLDQEFRQVQVTFDSKESENVLLSKCRVLSISKDGICIVVSKETFCSVKLTGEIELEGLNFFDNLENIKKAVVRNARLYSRQTIKSEESFAIGLQFND